jgi:hypothetical protein
MPLIGLADFPKQGGTRRFDVDKPRLAAKQQLPVLSRAARGRWLAMGGIGVA